MNFFFVLFIILMPPSAWAEVESAQNHCPQSSAAKLVSLQGSLYFISASEQWQSAQLNDFICEGSRLRVSEHSRASCYYQMVLFLNLTKARFYL